MSKTRKVIKLNSKPRQRSKKHDGKISSAQREALLREKAASREKTQVQIKSVPIGTKVAEPVRNNPAPKPIKKGLFGKLFSKKEKVKETNITVAPIVEDVKTEEPTPVVEQQPEAIAEEPAPIVEETPEVVEEAPVVEESIEEPAVEEIPAVASEEQQEVVEETPEVVEETPVVEEPIEEPAVEEIPAVASEEQQEVVKEPVVEETLEVVEEAPVVEESIEEPAVEEIPAVASEEQQEVVEEYTEEEKKEKKEVIIRLKKMGKAELMRFVKTTAKGTDDAILQMQEEQKVLDEKLAQIKSLKTPKDADDAKKKELNAQRATLRKERDASVKKLELLKNKAEALERANDQYSEVASNLIGERVNFRKQRRLCPVDPRLEKEIKELSEMVARGTEGK